MMQKGRFFKDSTTYISIGLLLIAVALVLDRSLDEMPPWLHILLLAVGSIALFFGLVQYRRAGNQIADERFILHRLKSSRIGLVTGLLAILALLFYNILAHDVISWDLVVIAGSIAVGKIGAMIYFRITG